jgi:hypothetical protein
MSNVRLESDRHMSLYPWKLIIIAQIHVKPGIQADCKRSPICSSACLPTPWEAVPQVIHPPCRPKLYYCLFVIIDCNQNPDEEKSFLIV